MKTDIDHTLSSIMLMQGNNVVVFTANEWRQLLKQCRPCPHGHIIAGYNRHETKGGYASCRQCNSDAMARKRRKE